MTVCLRSGLSVVGVAERREVRGLWGSAGMRSTQELARGLRCVKEKSNGNGTALNGEGDLRLILRRNHSVGIPGSVRSSARG